MGATPKRVAVVTGDIIDSRKYAGSARTRLNNALTRGVQLATSTVPRVALTRLDFRITAGDEFQFVLKSPERALEMLILLRSILALESVTPPIRFRAAVGVGAVKYRPSRSAAARPYEWDGPAFVRARSGLDVIKRQRSPERWTTIITGTPAVDVQVDVILGLADHLQRSWTSAQWEAIGWTMRGLKRHETARHLKVAHQNVSKRLNAAGWPAAATAMTYIRMLMTQHPGEGAKA